MTDRINAFVVILEHDLRDDDAQAIINAIRQLKGVLDVQPHVAGFDAAIAEARVRHELRQKLWKVLE